MRRKWLTVGILIAVVSSACGGGDDEPAVPATTEAPTTTAAATTTEATTSTSTSTSTTVPAATTTAPSTTTTGAPPAVGLALPEDPACVGVDGEPSARQLTFVAAGRLWAVGTDGTPICLAEVDADTSLAWSPRGDKAVLDDGTVLADGNATPTTTPIDGEVTGWTWPTGRRFLATDGPTLTKYEADGSGTSDATIADDHRVLAYHPDGIHFAVFGTAEIEFEEFDESGDSLTFTAMQRGLFIVRNNDPRPHLMIDPVGAEILDVVFSEDGTRLTFVADHDGDFHIHSLNLPNMLVTTDEDTLLTALQEDAELLAPQVESSERLGDLVVDPADPWRFLFAVGDPSGSMSAQLYDAASKTTVAIAPDLDARPVGFLDATTVAVRTTAGELWVVDLATDERRFVGVVDAAAVRDVAPDLALSLVDITIVGFA